MKTRRPRSGRSKPTDPNPWASAGFTLVELIASVAIMSLLLGAMASAVLLTRQAVPERGEGLVALVDASDVMQQLTSDLAQAVYILDHDSKSVTLVVPDRDADGRPETIRYAWSGTAGDPLTRRLNTAQPVAVLGRVADLALGFETEAAARVYDVSSGEASLGDEVLVAGHDNTVRGGFQINAEDWIANDLNPAAVFTATRWVPTRARVKALHGDEGYDVFFDVRAGAGDGTPADTVATTATLLSDDFPPTWDWVEVAYTDPPPMNVADGAYLNIRADGGKRTAHIRYDTDAGTGLMVSDDAGTSWTQWPARSMIFELYGAPVKPASSSITLARTRLTTATVTLKTADEQAVPLRMGTELPNRPEVLDAVWAADMAADPRAVDLNADGTGDFDLVSIGLLGLVVNLPGGPGTIGAEARLTTEPSTVFDRPVAVDVTWRDTTAAGAGVSAVCFADPGGGQVAELRLRLRREDDGTQTLTLDEWVPGGLLGLGSGWGQLARFDGLTGDAVHTQLLVVPSADTALVSIDDAYRGGFAYARASTSTARDARLETGDDAGLELHRLLVRVGGAASLDANRAPLADLDVNQTALPAGGGRVFLDADDSTDPDGDPLTYAWDLGDGATASGAYVDHWFSATSTVTLTVTDAFGASDTGTVVVTVP